MIIPTPAKKESNVWVLQFINIVFLIMLFFLVGGTISETSNSEVSPPITLQGEAASPPQNSLFIKADGTMVYSGETLTVDVFQLRWFAATQQLTIVADRNLKAQVLLRHLAVLRASGINNLVLTTVKSSP